MHPLSVYVDMNTHDMLNLLILPGNPYWQYILHDNEMAVIDILDSWSRDLTR